MCRPKMFGVFSPTRVALLSLKNLNVWQQVYPTCGTCGRKRPPSGTKVAPETLQQSKTC